MNKFAITAVFAAAIPFSVPAAFGERASMSSAGSAAAVGYFFKIGDIKGDSQYKDYKDQIDVLSWSWGMSGSGSSASFAPFSWEQELDSSFVPLFLAATKGTAYKTAEFTVTRADGKGGQQSFFSMTLGGAKIISLSSQGMGDGSVDVNAQMSFSSIKMTYLPQDSKGGSDSPIVATWDIKENKAAFSGDPQVMLGLAQAGGGLNFVNQVPEPATWASLAAGLAVVAGIARRRRLLPSKAERATG